MKSMHRIFVALAIILSSCFLAAQTQTLGLGSQAVPAVLQKSIVGASASPNTAALPAKVDNRRFAPSPGYQGETNSCVGWAVAYGAKSFQENASRNWGVSTPEHIFSPSFVYNQINGGQDNGSSIIEAMELIKNMGAATFKTMPFTSDVRRQPTSDAYNEAKQFPASSYKSLDPHDVRAIKTVLAAGSPVVIGMETHESFMNYRGGVYKATTGRALGGHAMAVIGYDDAKNAYLLLNSWSTQWGESGYAWIDYTLFGQLTMSAEYMQVAAFNKPQESAPPQDLQASMGSIDDRVRITWSEVQNSTGYQVYRSEKSQGNFALLSNVKDALYEDTSVKKGTIYFYSVKSLGPAGPSALSSVASGFSRQASVLGVPERIAIQASGTTIRLVWDSVAGADAYNVYRWDDAARKYRLHGRSSDTGYQDSTIPASNKSNSWYYVVSAARGKEESAASSNVSIFIPASSTTPLVTTTTNPPATTSTTVAPRAVTSTSTTVRARATTTTTTTTTTVAPKPKPSVVLSAVKGAQATMGEYTDKVVISWKPVRGATAYEVSLLNPADRRFYVLGTTRSPSYTHATSDSDQNYYAVVPLAGSVRGPMTSYILGFAQEAEYPAYDYSDYQFYDPYFGKAPDLSTEARVDKAEQDGAFKNDTFFTNSDKFFENFVPKDFFAIDVEKFFAVDPNFFTNTDTFFN